MVSELVDLTFSNPSMAIGGWLVLVISMGMEPMIFYGNIQTDKYIIGRLRTVKELEGLISLLQLVVIGDWLVLVILMVMVPMI